MAHPPSSSHSHSSSHPASEPPSNDFLRLGKNPYNLITYKKSRSIYLITRYFVRIALKRGDRTIDQMVQAARSGKQNIIEGAKPKPAPLPAKSRFVLPTLPKPVFKNCVKTFSIGFVSTRPKSGKTAPRLTPRPDAFAANTTMKPTTKPASPIVPPQTSPISQSSSSTRLTPFSINSFSGSKKTSCALVASAKPCPLPVAQFAVTDSCG